MKEKLIAGVIAGAIVGAVGFAVIRDQRHASTGDAARDAAGRQDASASATEHHLTLPGWEDLLPGHAPPPDVFQACSHLDDDSKLDKCRGCRSAKLPLPCVDLLYDPRKTEVYSIVVRLPDIEEEAAKVVDSLHAAWGAPTSTNGEKDWIEETWQTQWENAELITDNLDLQTGRRTTTPTSRVVHISARQPAAPRAVSDLSSPRGTAITGYDDYKNKTRALAARLVEVFKKDANDCGAIATDVTAITSDPDFIGVSAYQKTHDADKKKFDTESAAIEKDFIAAATPVVTKCKHNKNASAAFEKMQ